MLKLLSFIAITGLANLQIGTAKEYKPVLTSSSHVGGPVSRGHGAGPSYPHGHDSRYVSSKAPILSTYTNDHNVDAYMKHGVESNGHSHQEPGFTPYLFARNVELMQYAHEASRDRSNHEALNTEARNTDYYAQAALANVHAQHAALSHGRDSYAATTHGHDSYTPAAPANMHAQYEHSTNGLDNYAQAALADAYALYAATTHGYDNRAAPAQGHDYSEGYTPVLYSNGHAQAVSTHGEDHYAPAGPAHGQDNYAALANVHANRAAPTHDNYGLAMPARGEDNYAQTALVAALANAHAQYAALAHSLDNYAATTHGPDNHAVPAQGYDYSEGYTPVLYSNGHAQAVSSHGQGNYAARNHGNDNYAADSHAHHVAPTHGLDNHAALNHGYGLLAKGQDNYAQVLSAHGQDNYAPAMPSHGNYYGQTLTHGHSGLATSHSEGFTPVLYSNGHVDQHIDARNSIDQDSHAAASHALGLDNYAAAAHAFGLDNYATSAHGHSNKIVDSSIVHGHNDHVPSLYGNENYAGIAHGHGDHDQDLYAHDQDVDAYDQGLYAHDQRLYDHVEDYIKANDIHVSGHLPLKNVHGSNGDSHGHNQIVNDYTSSKRDPRQSSTSIEYSLVITNE